LRRLAVVCFAVGLTACGSDSDGTSGSATAVAAQVLTGSVTLPNSGSDWAIGAEIGDECVGYGGYEDIQAGTSVDVTNESGTIIASRPVGARCANPGTRRSKESRLSV